MSQEIINKTANHVRSVLNGDPAHNWRHVERVWKLAKIIAEKENADLFVVELAALLHDISDWKFNKGDDSLGPELARAWLEKNQIEEKIIAHVCEIIKDLSFKGAGVRSNMRTKEGMVVQDADRLDAIGAVGIARAFSYGGYKNKEIYNPDVAPELHDSFEKYKNSKGPTINHFYEKLLFLKDLMNTETARKLAEERHDFMLKFLEQFKKEMLDCCES